MGYHTNFTGKFVFDKPLTDAQREYLAKFAETRRMKREGAAASLLPDPVREAVSLPIGVQGGYFVGATGMCGQDHDDSVIDYNRPPDGQPGLWCQWTPNPAGTELAWDGGEKFYDYLKWLQYLINHFLTPWGRTITGIVSWKGEERGDKGKIIVKDSVLEVHKG